MTGGGEDDDRGHPNTGHEVPEGEQRYGSTLSSASALYPRERPSTHNIGDWVGPRAGLEGC